jgi:molybdopterin-guanine dinucleotide biosynthesis protein A
MPGNSVCGVILSGGMSRRFQNPGEPWVDKALHQIDGRPMISRTYDTISRVADSIVISIGLDKSRIDIYREYVGDAIYAEDIDGLRGPLSGILAGLLKCPGDRAIVVPVDMPYIEKGVLESILSSLDSYTIASPVLPNGLVETTVAALRREYGVSIQDILRRRSRSRVADLHRGAPSVYLLNLKKHGYSPMSIVNINTRSDLDKGARYPEGPLDDDVYITRGFDVYDIIEMRFERLRGSLWWTLETGDPYDELKTYLSRGLYMFASYALMDSRNAFERYAGEALLNMLYRDI